METGNLTTIPLPLADLQEFISDEAQSGGEGEMAMLAGHFAIFSAGGQPQDYLEEGDLPEIARSMVSFTKTTWEIGCSVLSGVGCRVRLALLVDDVAFLRPKTGDRSTAERLAAALSELYLRKLNPVPRYHLDVLRRFGLSTDLLINTSDGRFVFSERELRSELVRMTRSESVRSQPGVRFSNDESAVSVQLDDHEYQLVYSGNTNCVGAYLGLHKRLLDAEIKKVVLMVPSRCFGPMCTGRAVAPVIGYGGCEIITVSMPEAGTGDVALVSR